MPFLITPQVAEFLDSLYEENKPKIEKIPAHPFDIEKATLWADLQPEKYKLFCHLFLKYQIHVSGQDFLEAVSRLGNDIESRMLMGKYAGIIVCSDLLLDTTKSNFWVFLLLYPYLRKYLIALARDLIDAYNVVLAQDQSYLIILPDDMAYSGEQLSEVFDYGQFPHSIQDRYKAAFHKTDVLIAVPYLSTKAYERLIEKAQGLAKEVFNHSDFPLKFSDVTRRIIPLETLLEKEGKYEVSRHYVDDLDNCALYFDHKLADELSSFPAIYDYAPIPNEQGQVVDSLGSLIKNCPSHPGLKNFLRQESCPKGFYKNINYTYLKEPLTTRVLHTYLRELSREEN